MDTGGRRDGAVSYEKMVNYVASEVEPIADRAAAHDSWHRDRLVDEAKRRSAQFFTTISLLIAAGSMVIAGVAVFVGHA